MKDLLRCVDLGCPDLATILALADGFVRDADAARTALAGQTVVVSLAGPTVYTRVAADTAITRLGGTPVHIDPQELAAEAIEDAAQVLGSYTTAAVLGGTSDTRLRRFAEATDIAVVNAGTDAHAPLHALTDLFTLREVFGDLTGRRIAWVGPIGPSAHSLLELVAIAGLEIALAVPSGHEPHPDLMIEVEKLAAETGARISLCHAPYAAVKGASAVLTERWPRLASPDEPAQPGGYRARHDRIGSGPNGSAAGPGGSAADPDFDAQPAELEAHPAGFGVRSAGFESRPAGFSAFRVDARLLAAAAPDAVFLEHLPVSRGNEVAAEVVNGPRSRVLIEAADRLPVLQAILFHLISGGLRGRPGEPW